MIITEFFSRREGRGFRKALKVEAFPKDLTNSVRITLNNVVRNESTKKDLLVCYWSKIIFILKKVP